ncbi:hypothetical protein ACIGHB_29940 [Streptomyces sp. NPDC085460]|uniref:hypothetical protein n=1 Tax=Streptomyces sp. NPDC085460 TaxID=3365723 RepID=UPI0037D3B74D
MNPMKSNNEPAGAPSAPAPSDVAADLIAAVEEALDAGTAPAPSAPLGKGPEATGGTGAQSPAPALAYFRDDSPVPSVGDALPVAQPGRPPMSPRATDVSVVMLAGGAGVLMAGGGTGFALWALAGVSPVTLALAVGAPVAVVAALARLVRSAGQAAVQAAPVTHHHTYSGPVAQTNTSTTATTARGLFARNVTKER